MIKLDLKREPYWLDIADGLRLSVRPASSALIMGARVAALKDEGVERGTALLRQLALLAILAWEGVGDAEGLEAPVTNETVLALMDLWPVAEAFERLYLLPSLILDQEKNA